MDRKPFLIRPTALGTTLCNDAHPCGPPRYRPRRSGDRDLYRGEGGVGDQRPEQQQLCVPTIDLQVRAPSMNFVFSLGNSFLMWVGGWVRRRSPGRPLPPR